MPENSTSVISMFNQKLDTLLELAEENSYNIIKNNSNDNNGFVYAAFVEGELVSLTLLIEKEKAATGNTSSLRVL